MFGVQLRLRAGLQEHGEDLFGSGEMWSLGLFRLVQQVARGTTISHQSADPGHPVRHQVQPDTFRAHRQKGRGKLEQWNLCDLESCREGLWWPFEIAR